MTAPTTSTSSNKSTLWSTAKRIFKPKVNKPLQSQEHSSPSSPIEDDDDDFPILSLGEFTPSKQHDSPVRTTVVTINSINGNNNSGASGNNHNAMTAPKKLALPSPTMRSKATVATASTALSTVNTGSQSYSPSFTLSTTPNGASSRYTPSHQDEFSYSCAASSTWTGGNNTPNNRMENHGNLGNAAIVGGKGANVPGLPLHNGIESITEEQEEEKDGFVELITERQRSRHYSSVEESANKPDHVSASSKTSGSDAKKSNSTNQGYYAQGYNLMGFHQNNPFASATSSEPASTQDKADNNAPTSGAQGAVRVDSSNTNNSKNIASATSTAIETKKSESPDKPPSNQRKHVNAEFFMEDTAVPPSPTSNKHRLRQQGSAAAQQQALEEQRRKQQPQQVQPNHDDYENPKHLYAEINVKHRPQPLTREGSEGTASLAMTSISSITGHGSLFAKEYDINTSTFNSSLNPLPGGLWRMSSTAIMAKPEEENYFDYSNDETLNQHRNTSMLDRLGNAISEMFYSTCQCFDVKANAASVPVSSSQGGKVTTEGDLVLNETTVNQGTNNAVITVTTQGKTSKGGKNGVTTTDQPMYSSPMN